jgi:cytochrome c-type biogenesis protein CcmH
MTEFWIVAACMCVFALAFLVWPIWRARETSGNWPLPGLIAAAALVPLSVLVYQHVRTWNGDTEAGAVAAANAEQLSVVNQLAERMQDDPDNVEGWLLLGRSYLTLQQYADARMAFLQAWQRTPAPDNTLKLGLAMAMIHSDPATISADGGQLIEEVLASEPRNQQALWYGGLVAAERGRVDLARTRWATLLQTNPPAEIAQVLQQQLAQLDALSGVQGRAPAGTGQPVNAAAASADGPVIRLRLSLGDQFSANEFGPSSRLFIFARAQAGGPPLAVVPASVSDLPGEFTLSDANVMIQGNQLSNYEEIQLVARISRSGTPTQQSGDVYAETRHIVADGGVVELVLDQVAP